MQMEQLSRRFLGRGKPDLAGCKTVEFQGWSSHLMAMLRTIFTQLNHNPSSQPSFSPATGLPMHQLPSVVCPKRRSKGCIGCCRVPSSPLTGNRLDSHGLGELVVLPGASERCTCIPYMQYHPDKHHQTLQRKWNRPLGEASRAHVVHIRCTQVVSWFVSPY